MAYPILCEGDTWFTRGAYESAKEIFTEITIVDSYTPTGDETEAWDASDARDGSIMVYVGDTNIIIAGNGSGGIALNKNSQRLFGFNPSHGYSFKNVSIISGLELFDTSNVEDASYMFSEARNLYCELNLSTWDVSNVKHMNHMFYSCNKLTSLNVSNWDVSSVTGMQSMFCGCSSLTSLDLSGWQTVSLTDPKRTFYGCSSLTSLNLNGWDVSRVTSIEQIFMFCSSLTSLDLSTWDVSNMTDIREAFCACSSLTSLNLNGWDVSNCTNFYRLFRGCLSLTALDIADWNVSKVTNMCEMFAGDSSSKAMKLSSLDVSRWNTSSCTNMSFMFYACSKLGTVDISNWDVSKVTNFDHMFAHSKMSGIDVSKWHTSSAINMNAMFHTIYNETIDVSRFDTSNVQFFCQMFERNINLVSIKGLENFDTSNVLGFDQMFDECASLKELNLSSFDTRKAKDGVTASTNGGVTKTLSDMFTGCNSLEKIIIGENFVFNGDGTCAASSVGVFPTPTSENIQYADGNWYNANNEAFAPTSIPSGVAGVYYATAPRYRTELLVKYGSLEDIADAIREKTGKTDFLTLDDMATDIPKVYDAGKKSQYDEFWDNYQAPMIAGKNVPNMFSGSCWNGTTFYPKYNIKPTYGANLFNYFSWSVTPLIDLAQRLEECGVTLDTSQTSTVMMFSYCYVTRIPKIDATFAILLDRTFQNTTATIIDELVLKENGANTFSNTFQNCSNLEEIRITGKIGKNGFSVSDSKKLSYDSLMSIINALKDYSTDTSGTTYTVTLGTTNLAKLTNEEKAIATQKGWSLA